MDARRDAFEQQLSLLCREMDNVLEDKFGTMYQIHPNRLQRGQGSNPSFDGLFATSLAFTLGYGSQYGRGYVVRIEIRTLESVSKTVKHEIESFAFAFLSEKLPLSFPDRKLGVVMDGSLMKITGDFSLN